ncbi:hypothetical protein [Nonomuraea sp. NPDC050783]|uniref:hypothetical protein n=1 Tax=Nonomuraea sp. NPDC050783 TaxID=3154634 RepID=UPI0034678288
MGDWVDTLAAWAWARHHNILSWYVRPLFLLPFCYFAYRRAIWGIVLTLVALVTSMAWFPAPERPDPAVLEFLNDERDYLLGEWTAAKVLMGLLVPLVFVALALALWRRSFVWALVVINAALLFKIGWSFRYSSVTGALALLVPALVGLVVVDLVIVVVRRRILAARGSGT